MHPRKAFHPSVFACPILACRKICKSSGGLSQHINTSHPNFHAHQRGHDGGSSLVRDQPPKPVSQATPEGSEPEYEPPPAQGSEPEYEPPPAHGSEPGSKPPSAHGREPGSKSPPAHQLEPGSESPLAHQSEPGS